jgi:hypothetical protein
MTRKIEIISGRKRKKNNPGGCITLEEFNSYPSHILREYQIHSKHNDKQKRNEEEEKS